MKRNSFRRNNEAQVLGLPMYLIIIMIVAVAVIAAVVFMMPQGSKQIDAQVTQSSLLSFSGNGRINKQWTGDDIKIKVVTKDDSADPISGATVTLTGAGVAFEEKTDDDGIATITKTELGNVVLEENKNIDYITVNIKASGFEDYEDTEAIKVVRTK